jgi:magnesium transporter
MRRNYEPLGHLRRNRHAACLLVRATRLPCANSRVGASGRTPIGLRLCSDARRLTGCDSRAVDDQTALRESGLGTARAAVRRDVPSVEAGATVADLRDLLSRRPYRSVADIVVLRNGRPLGLIPVEGALAAPGDARIDALARPATLVAPDDDLEVAARRTIHAGGRSLLVVDGDGRYLGLVPPEALLRLLESEHEEDMARLGGFVARAAGARSASEETVPRRLWHRLPWLAVGLAGAMASAAIVGFFEEDLRREVLLALFVPAVVYIADAVGTQTETLVIRGMSVGVRMRDIVARELVTGLVVGLLLGAAFFGFAFAVWGDGAVAATVGIALVVSCSVATVVAMALPYALARLGSDPAFGSGPLATVIQDLFSILAYFAIAVLIVS